MKGSEGETLCPGGSSGRRKQEKEVVLPGCCSLPCVYENKQVSVVCKAEGKPCCFSWEANKFHTKE